MDALSRAPSTRKKPASNLKRARPTSARIAAKNNSPDLFWIVISNVHKKVAQRNIFQALFNGCATMRSHAFQSSSASRFRGTVEVAFFSEQGAEEAVNRYQDNIKLFHKRWLLSHRRKSYNRYCDTASSSSSSNETVTSRRRSSPEPPDGGIIQLAQASQMVQIIEDVAVGTGKTVVINNKDIRVPKEVILPLIETAGRFTKYAFHDGDGNFHGAVEVVYKRKEEAIAAFNQLDRNITFFRKTWFLALADDCNAAQNPIVAQPEQ